MKKIKRILSLLLAALMFVGTVPVISAAGVTFTDVSSHWAWNDGYIPYLTEKGVINGIKQADGTYMFKPESAVTRAQYVKMMVETFGLTDTVEIDYDNFVPDQWYYSYFEKAAAQGFLVNYGKDVNPNAAITREEAVALTVRYLDISSADKADPDYFTDYNKISSWYKDDVLLAVGDGIVDGIKQTDGTYMFKPQNTLTRAQALTIIFKAAGCIFDGSTSTRDSAAHTVNNTINKGSMTISGVTFNGRNIITEGADAGKITLTNCKVNGTLYVRGGAELVLNGTTAGEIVVSGGGNVTLKNNAKVEILTLDTTSNVDIEKGNVETLNVMPDAKNTKITGKGDIETLVINATGLNSAIIPTKYTIANGVSALIGTDTVEGSNASGEAFTTAPYATSDGSYYAVNVITGAGGTIKLYYTNDKKVPSTSEFDAIYGASKYTFKFSVKKGELTSQNTVPVDVGAKYKYVVVQLVSGPTNYKPVVISNSVLVGDGFNTAPEFIAKTYDISINPETDGTVYWYYSTDGSVLSQGQFLQAYSKTEKALRGTMTVKEDTETLIALNSIYTKNYTYICIMATDSNGNYYTPVVVSVGDSDFVDNPTLSAKDAVVFTPKITGTLYYYFSKTASLPSKTDYLKSYNSISYRNKMSVKANVQSTFTFNSDLVEAYPYIIFALADSEGNFSQPFALYAYCETGFTSGPSVGDGNTIKFKTEEDGYVVYYYSASNIAPDMSEIAEIYDEVPTYLKGTVDVTADKEITLEYDPSNIIGYPYMVLMFINKRNAYHFPAVVSLKDKTDYADVFATAPKFDGKNKVTFSTNFDGYIYYFYSDESSSKGNFYNNWKDAEGSELRALRNAQGTITVPESNTKQYLHIGFSHTDEFDGIYIVSTASIDLEQEIVPEKLSGYGFSSRTISATIFITPKVKGTMYYYKTNDVNDLPAGDFMAAYNSASEKGSKAITSTTEFTLSAGAFKYIVIMMKNMDGNSYEYKIIETTSGDVVDDTQPTTSGFSRNADDIGDALSGCKFSFTAEVDGTMYISYTIGGNTVAVTNFSVTAGEHYSYNLTTTIQTIKNLLDSTKVPLVKFNFQIKDGNKEYKKLTLDIEEFR